MWGPGFARLDGRGAHPHTRMGGIADELIFADDGAHCAPGERRLYEIVAVEAVAFYREEKFARLHRAGIDGVAVGRHRRVERSEERRVGKECRSRWSPSR